MSDAQRWASARAAARAATYSTFGVAASYSPALGGAATDVLVRRSAPDEITEWGGGGRALRSTTILLVRASDCPALARGDTFTIDGETLVVQGQPTRDVDRLIWTAEVIPA